MEEKNNKSRAVIAIILSLLTIIGGHFVNRRLDRVILFLSILLLVVLIPIVVYYLNFMFMAVDGFEKMMRLNTLIYQAISWSGLAVWIISTVVAANDALNPPSAALDKLSVMTVASGTVLAMVIGIIAWSLVSSSLFFSEPSYKDYVSDTDAKDVFDDGKAKSRVSTFFDSKFFNHFINFGGHRYASGQLDDLPEGEGYLTGLVTHNDKPAVGMAFKLILNNQYEKDQVKTDKNGRFQIRLPEGTWYVNRINSESWDNKPKDGDYLLVSDYERALTGNRYHRSQEFSQEGLEVQVTDNPDSNLINLYVKKSVNVLWPDGDKPDADVDTETDAIEWEAYPDAVKYHIKITSIKREGRTTSFFPVVQTVTEDNGRYPLSNLKIVHSGDAGEISEYGVEITAFTEDGRFLSESESFTPSTSFKLKNGFKILDDQGMDILANIGMDSPEDTQKLYDNRKKMNAIEILIGEGRLETANEMLQELEGPLDAGKKKALEGYILAKEGKCEEANKIFDQATEEGGLGCVPSSYKKDCN